jgi:hypothetical protein
MDEIEVRLPVFHDETSPLNDVAALNIKVMSSTRLTSHRVRLLLKLYAAINIFDILVTRLVFHAETSPLKMVV